MIVARPVAMHIPDGFLSGVVSLIFWAFAVIAVVVALFRVSRDLGEREVPMMGVLGAAIFAGQMLNFTVTGGTSGHLLGAALATILVGPWAAVLIMTSVVGIQALIFQDGGLVVLGANLFNMAVIGVAVSFFVYRFFQFLARGKSWGIFVGGFVAAWSSIFIASLNAGLQLAISGTSPANIAIPAMAGIHTLIGIGEGLITIGALSLVYAARRDLLKIGKPQPAGSKGILVVGVLLAVALAVLSPLASAYPDGLESVAAQYGFVQAGQAPSYEIIPDYVVPGISNEALATILAGVIGVVIVLGVSLGLAYWRRRKGAEEEE